VKGISKKIYLSALLSFMAIAMLTAQTNNLRIQFRDAASAPRFLNVCGDEQLVVVTVTTDGVSGATRSNLTATLTPFNGIIFTGFDAGASTAGVSMQSGGSSPTFRLPDLNFGNVVHIAYRIRANCGYTDTLTANDLLTVQDQWRFNYTQSGQSLTETDLGTEYRDAIKVPFFTMSITNSAARAARVGDCFSRTVTINNSGLQGFVKDFVYTNLQGPGISVSNIVVNGQTVAVSKQPAFNASGDTLITAIISGNVFRNNTLGAGGLADGDTLFEPDETVRIVENICVTSCYQSRISNHAMNWGCDARYCQTLSRQDIIRLAEGTISVLFSPSGSTPRQDAGYCQTGRHSVRFYNNGLEVDPETASMMNISAGAGLGNLMALTAPGYRITRINIAGVDVNNPTDSILMLEDYPQFAADPDGAGVGLADLDGDGFFDDLPRGQGFDILIEYETPCTSLQSASEHCTNDIEAGFTAQLEYTNACRERMTVARPNYYSPLNANDMIDDCADPDANTDGRPFKIEHTQRRNVFNFAKNCSGQEQFLVKIKLPTGITPIMDSMRWKRFTDTFRMASSRISNDTLYMYFDASTQTFLNGDYMLEMGFSAGCTAVPGESDFPVEVSFLCAPCGCNHIWYCDTIAGPRIHYLEPPCVPNPAYVCAKGLKTVDFKANRTTLGYTDETLTTRIDPSVANRKVAVQCDTVEMCIKNVVGATPISDSIGMVIYHQNVDLTNNTQNPIFLFARGVVRIKSGGNNYECTISPTSLRTWYDDTTRYYSFDLHQCLTGLGLTLTAGDSVNFCGYFTVNPDGPYSSNFKKIPDFRAYGYYRDGGAEFACDNYGELFRLGKNQVLFAYPNSSNMPNGCDEAQLEYKILFWRRISPLSKSRFV
jgi:hypothetical protein